MTVDLHPCGTTTGYYRHWHAKEPACRGCKTAVAVYQNRRRRAAGMKPRTAPMCGTDSGYSLHMRNRTIPCRLCKDAHAAYRNAWIEAKHRRARRGTIPAARRRRFWYTATAVLHLWHAGSLACQWR